MSSIGQHILCSLDTFQDRIVELVDDLLPRRDSKGHSPKLPFLHLAQKVGVPELIPHSFFHIVKLRLSNCCIHGALYIMPRQEMTRHERFLVFGEDCLIALIRRLVYVEAKDGWIELLGWSKSWISPVVIMAPAEKT